MTGVLKMASVVRQAQLTGLCRLHERFISSCFQFPWLSKDQQSSYLCQKRRLHKASKNILSPITYRPLCQTEHVYGLCDMLTHSTANTSVTCSGVQYRFSSNKAQDISELRANFYSTQPTEEKEDLEAQMSVFQRFKRAYKEHGKVLIGVHLVTSTVWYGSFYAAAAYGFDIIPILEQLGASETILKPFKAGGLGDIALAYLMYKVATPARYTVTLGGTNLVIRYFKKTGKINVSKEDSLRNLYADGKSVLQDNKDKMNTIRKERINEYIKAAREKRNHLKR